MTTLMNGIKSQRSQRSDRFWFYDGTVLVSLAPLVYKVHKSIFDRHSSKFTLWLLDVEDPAALALSRAIDHAGTPVIVIPSDIGVSVEDFETLLAHLYHDSPLRRESPFPQLARVLRVSSPRQLGLTSIFELAKGDLATLFPGGPIPFAHLHRVEHLEEGLELALQHDADLETRKALLYSVATSTNFDPKSQYDPSGPDSHDDASGAGAPHPALSPRTLRICHRLLSSLIADFTPVLFTVGAASHMQCTDALADYWMSDVITPALADGGVGHPLETLTRIASQSWKERGVCEECVESKKVEWGDTAKDIWEKIGGWVEEAEKEFRRD
ncbi:hypothetical protein EDB87DRAFT_1673568 [Lactarius vividus]|nr:hypothetical protein EDB87DRAFT_1673568 [Lactarius vividus]